MATREQKQNSEEVKKNTQAAAKAGEELANNMADYAKEADAVIGNIADLADMMRKTASSSRDFGGTLKEATNLTKQIATQAKAVTKFTAEDVKSKRETEKFLKRELIVKGQIQAIESKIKNLTEQALVAEKEEAALLTKQAEDLTKAAFEAEQLLNAFEGIRKENDRLNSKTKFFDRFAEVLGDIPGVGKFFNEFGKAAQDIRDAGGTFKSQLIGGLNASISLLGKFTLLTLITEFVNAITRSQKQVKTLTSNLNMSRMEAEKVRQEFTAIGNSEVGKTAQDLVDAVEILGGEMGIVADTTNKDLLLGLSTAVHKLGLANNEAIQLAKFSQVSGENFKDFQNNIAGSVELLNVSNGTAIRFQAVMKDIADAGAATLLTTDKFPGGIEKAAYQTRRFGLSMAMVNSAAESLLDFESSIQSELEAELLTGKELNLERARAAALTGDTATLAEEVRKNAGSIAEFTAMSVPAQKALAQAMGLSRDEVAQMLMDEKAIAEMGGDRSKSLGENVQKKLEEIAILRQQGKLEDAELKRKELINTVGSDQLKTQIRNQTFQERMLEIMEDFNDTLVNRVNPALESMTDFFGKISQNIEGVGEFFGKLILKATKFGTALKVPLKIFQGLGGLISKILSSLGKFGKMLSVSSLAKGMGKMGGKMLLKKIPILGALYGGYLAVKRVQEGDYLGGLMEFGSGLLSILPGLGTAGSLAMDAAIVARDTTGATGFQTGLGSNEEEADFISRPGQGITSFRKDDIIIGGTNLLGGGNGVMQALERQNALLESILNKDTDVKMNSYSVQSALVVDSFKNG